MVANSFNQHYSVVYRYPLIIAHLRSIKVVFGRAKLGRDQHFPHKYKDFRPCPIIT